MILSRQTVLISTPLTGTVGLRGFLLIDQTTPKLVHSVPHFDHPCQEHVSCVRVVGVLSIEVRRSILVVILGNHLMLNESVTSLATMGDFPHLYQVSHHCTSSN